MKKTLFVLTVIVGCGVLSLQSGCQQPAKEPAKPKIVEPQTLKPEPQTLKSEPKTELGNPKIEFEKTVHDFGEISPLTNHVCEFNFKNAGDGLLKITNVTKTCGCTPFTLAKKEYAPGETGTLKVRYHAGQTIGPTKKSLTVSSNDKKTPQVKITIKAKIAEKVSYNPRKINFVRKNGNVACPDITLTSTDNKPFSITQFRAKGGCITADFDPARQATTFVLKPKVNVEKLKNYLSGTIEIVLTHPDAQKIVIFFNSLPEYEINPSSITVLNAKPKQALTRELWILNNYEEEFEIESATSQKGLVKIMTQEKVGNRYQFKLEITPPEKRAGKRLFTDTIYVNIKGGRKLQIPCRGFYNMK